MHIYNAGTCEMKIHFFKRFRPMDPLAHIVGWVYTLQAAAFYGAFESLGLSKTLYF